MELLVSTLFGWIAAYTPYDTSHVPPPDVIELSAKAMTAEYYQDNSPLILNNKIDPRIVALYSWEDGDHGTIFVLNRNLIPALPDGKSGLENPVFQENLLHELIHHVQYHVGAYERFACDSEGERDAYYYGGLFLSQQNVTDPLPNRKILAQMYSRC